MVRCKGDGVGKVRDNVLVRVENPAARFIGYQLHILGIRVWEHSCQLIARSGAEWSTLGPRSDLPVNVPHKADELKAASEDPLRLTAFQYCAEYPGQTWRKC